MCVCVSDIYSDYNIGAYPDVCEFIGSSKHRERNAEKGGGTTIGREKEQDRDALRERWGD